MFLYELLAVSTLVVVFIIAVTGSDPVRWMKGKYYKLADEFYKATGW